MKKRDTSDLMYKRFESVLNENSAELSRIDPIATNMAIMVITWDENESAAEVLRSSIENICGLAAVPVCHVFPTGQPYKYKG